jgi:hypothetical protein
MAVNPRHTAPCRHRRDMHTYPDRKNSLGKRDHYAIACNRVRRDRRAPALNWAPHCVQKAIQAKGFTKNVLVELRHAYRSVDKSLFAVHAPIVVDNVHG